MLQEEEPEQILIAKGNKHPLFPKSFCYFPLVKGKPTQWNSFIRDDFDLVKIPTESPQFCRHITFKRMFFAVPPVRYAMVHSVRGDNEKHASQVWT